MSKINKDPRQHETFSHFDENMKPVSKVKKSYDTLDDAIKACKILNKEEKQIRKLVSYKCNICFKYHIGRNNTILKK